MLDSWPLWVQWAVLLVTTGGFFGSSWWLFRNRLRTQGAEPATRKERLRAFVKELRFIDWAVTVVLLSLLIPLAIRTVTST